MKLLFLGDSLVAFHNWQSRFPDHAPCNCGVAGETVAGLLANLPFHLRRCPTPDRVFIMIGTNNLLREEYGFLPEYAAILDILGSALPPAQITVTSLPPIRAAHLAPSVVPRLNEGLLQLSRQKKAAFLDLCSAFNTQAPDAAPCFAEDGVHFSDLGYTLWAAWIARFLQHFPFESRRFRTFPDAISDKFVTMGRSVSHNVHQTVRKTREKPCLKTTASPLTWPPCTK